MCLFGNVYTSFNTPHPLQEYKLVSDTLFLAVSYIDRFLSVQNVPRQQLQLVGVASLLLASKNEEIYCPMVSCPSHTHACEPGNTICIILNKGPPAALVSKQL
jgi:hypothetical protein